MQVFEIEPLKRRALALLRAAPRSSIELAVTLAVPLWAVDAVLDALLLDRHAMPVSEGWGLTCAGRELMAGVPL